jgi:KaiC/GvpD/RAD55 family RecA-like ATPase
MVAARSDPRIEKLRALLEPKNALARQLENAKSQLEYDRDGVDLPQAQRKRAGELLSTLTSVSLGYIQQLAKGDEDAILQEVMRYWSDPGHHNPVLLYSVAAKAGLDKVLRTVAKRAFDAYLAQFDLYNFALGDFIPPDLKKQAAGIVTTAKFWDGTHSTAREDWEVFLTQFNGQPAGLTTGLPGLDAALGGGINNLTFIGADEGDGKTSLALSMVVSALRSDADLDCLFYTIDQPKKATMAKLYSLATGCDSHTLTLPSDRRSAEVNRRIKDGEAELRDSLLRRIRFVEKASLTPHAVLSYETFVGHHKDLNDKTHATRGILVIDMFQSLDRLPDGVVMDNDKDDYRLEMIRRFRQTTKSDSCPDGYPVIVTSEVRKVERVALTANDLRGSARLGSYPENILLLWPPENTEQRADVVPRVLMVAKSRFGHESILQVNFHHTFARFTEIPSGTPAMLGGNLGGSGRSRGLDGRNAL